MDDLLAVCFLFVNLFVLPLQHLKLQLLFVLWFLDISLLHASSLVGVISRVHPLFLFKLSHLIGVCSKLLFGCPDRHPLSFGGHLVGFLVLVAGEHDNFISASVISCVSCLQVLPYPAVLAFKNTYRLRL